ncbi:hypothetical protein ACJX0J_037071, partial [Zea mays]
MNCFFFIILVGSITTFGIHHLIALFIGKRCSICLGLGQIFCLYIGFSHFFDIILQGTEVPELKWVYIGTNYIISLNLIYARFGTHLVITLHIIGVGVWNYGWPPYTDFLFGT